jgi:hypothetical protein
MGTATKRLSKWPNGRIPRAKYVPNAQPTLAFNRRGLRIIDIGETIAAAKRERGGK